MKTFKTFILITILSTLLFPIRSYANEITEVTPNTEENVETVPLIYGMDATVRDCDNLNVRLTPDTSSEILITIPFGDHFTILDQNGKWFEILYHDFHGFVFWKYVSFTEEVINNDSTLLGNSIIHYTSSDNRDVNISVACSNINGIILNPGDQFCWSSIVGQTSIEKGYLQAPVIMNHQSVLGLGGGVCQVSTTIYNALLDTSIVPSKVYSHSIGCAYAKNDATVAHGSKDFVFSNSYDFPIQIEAYSYKAVVFVNIYKLEQK